MSGKNGEALPENDEFDRQRRRVLWALPTGLYLIGSRHADTVNLMTANLLTQVCIEPKLVGVAVEANSVTAGLIDQGQAFTVSMLARQDKDIVRRFVKPVPADQVERAADGTVTSMVGHAVTEVGRQKLPVLAAAAGYLLCQLTDQRPLGSHTFCIGEVIEVGGEPSEVLRMEDTRMHYGG
ncbi:MAG TPA: flavin reductase family protein [Acidimicrobiales bacterium]